MTGLPDAAGADGGFVATDDLPDGVVVADANGIVRHINNLAARILGIRPDAAVGAPAYEVLQLADLEGNDWLSCLNPYGGLLTRTGLVENSWHTPDGREVLVMARLIRSHRSGPVERLVVSLRPARQREHGDRMRAELVATVAHELRSPLTGVKGFTATLLAKWDRFSDAQRRLMLETVDADADRLTRLITELLDIARIDSGRLTLNKRLVDVEDMLLRHMARYEGVERSDRKVQLVSKSDQPTDAWLDPDKLDQVLGNLVENALRHGAGDVTLTVARLKDHLRVDVDDEGDGIPADLRERVFNRFWRTAPRGGSGLGLYIVRGLVEAHGGSVAVLDSPSGGARVQVLLPAAPPDI